MTVYKPPRRRTFDYDFWFHGKRYVGNTKQTTQREAEAVEAKVKERLRQEAGGIAVPQREDSPFIRDFAELFLAHKTKTLSRPEALGDILPVVLQFWGAPDDPKTEPTLERPYHNLRLCDPITDPDWVLKYEAWLASRLDRRGRPMSNQSKNHYRGLMRRMYACAMLPEYRKRTGVAMNPFAGVPNEPTVSRDVTVTKTQLRTWLKHASYHIRLAVAIGALAPKLRERNILELQWAHIEPDPRTTRFNAKTPHYIKVARHKTVRRIGRPLVSPVSAQLLRILRDAWQRTPASEFVVTYRGVPVRDINGGVRASIEAAGLPYGRDLTDAEGHAIGITFHTLRHTATTLLSDKLADPMQLMDAAGHVDMSTTMNYRHSRPRHQKPAVEHLSRSLPIEDLVTAPHRRAKRKTA
jgi:integrase